MDEPLIVTEGTGWVERTADRADLSLSFDARGRDRTSAVGELNKRMARAAAPLGLAGLTVRSRHLAVHTEYRNGKPAGCRASESLQVRVDDLDVLEAALSQLVAAEPAHLSGPSWSLADPAAVLAEAQAKAVADARHRAEGYAAALGGRLGALTRLSEVGEPGAAPMMAMRARGMAESAPDVGDLGLDPEPVRVSARCTTTWTFLPG